MTGSAGPFSDREWMQAAADMSGLCEAWMEDELPEFARLMGNEFDTLGWI